MGAQGMCIENTHGPQFPHLSCSPHALSFPRFAPLTLLNHQLLWGEAQRSPDPLPNSTWSTSLFQRVLAAHKPSSATHHQNLEEFSPGH